jgi:predicted Zn finger-like uncharacterized protein
MTCSCPKCHAQIEIDLPKIPENGAFTPCPECKGRLWVSKESYARMAITKEGKTYCDKCEEVLDHKIVCVSCGVIYPDYYLIQASKPPRRQVEKPSFNMSGFSLRPARPSYTSTYTYTGTERSSEKSPKTFIKRVGILAIVAILVIGAGFIYQKYQRERQYAKNYMRTLYTITLGTNVGLNTCAKISTDWKMKMAAGQNYAPRISDAEEVALNRIKDTTDVYMLKLNEPPKKFIKSKEKLANLYGAYIKVHAIATAPSGSLSSFTDSAAKSQNNFKVAVNDLKASLPIELSEEFLKAQKRFKALRYI